MFFFIFCFYIISLVNCSIELELKHSMMTNYSKTIIPKADPLDLTMGIAFRAFNSIDHIESVITSNIWLRHYWRDNRLVWVPNEWGNITSMVYPTDPENENSIWIPDIFIYNTAELPMSELSYSNAIVYNNGDIIWSRPGLLKTTCTFDLGNFPFDKQTCEFKFGSWSYHGGQLNMSIYDPDIDISSYQYSDSWDLMRYDSRIEITKYACCPDFYPSIIFTIELNRKGGYYYTSILIPTFAIAVLMVISLVIPWNSGERISFSTTVLLSIIVFLLILSDSLPKTDTNPILLRILMGLMFFSLIIVFFTVILSAIRDISPDSFRGKQILWLFDKLCRYFKCKKSMNRTDSYNSALRIQSSLMDECNKCADYIEMSFTVLFVIGFIIYCIIVSVII